MVSKGDEKMKITGYKVFSWVNVLLMLLILLVTAYPVYYIVVASFSSPQELSRHSGILWSVLKPFTTSAYKMVFRHALIFSGFKNTLFILVVGLVVNMVLTILGAYFLSVEGPMLKTPITFMIIFTMYFSGGMIPGYLNVQSLGLLNTRWSLILVGAISTTNLIIMKSAFQSIPSSLTEAARLDGASYLQILLKIMIPLSKATLAVLVLYYGVSHWNSWFSASIYIRDTELYPLQLVMRNILALQDQSMSGIMSDVSGDEAAMVAELIKYALIVVGTAPILVLYPFLQKHFVKGVMVGAIKG